MKAIILRKLIQRTFSEKKWVKWHINSIVEGEELDYENANIVNRSNKELVSDGSAQKLSEQEIKKLKEQGNIYYS
jgi:hypothetical protein